MAISRRLTATFAFKAAGAVPKLLYLGYDADEAKAALESAKDKDFWEIRVCRNIDAFWLTRWKASSAEVKFETSV
jgi:hypothetical protein